MAASNDIFIAPFFAGNIWWEEKSHIWGLIYYFVHRIHMYEHVRGKQWLPEA